MHTVIIDLNEWEVLSSISGSLQNMCVSTASSQDNLPSTVIYNLQLAASIKMLPEGIL